MKEIKLPLRPERIIVALADEISEHDIERLDDISFDLFIYKYKDGGYDGSGFAIWRNGDKFGYQEMGHCSCNGPLEDIKTSSNALFTLEEIEALAEKNFYKEEGAEVVSEMRKRIS